MILSLIQSSEKIYFEFDEERKFQKLETSGWLLEIFFVGSDVQNKITEGVRTFVGKLFVETITCKHEYTNTYVQTQKGDSYTNIVHTCHKEW